jgi:hypothetical protein
MPNPINVSIPNLALPVGTRTFGPAALGAGFHEATITLDRTVASGLNAAPTTTTITMVIEESTDSGATWHGLNGAGDTTTGGTTSNHNGQINLSITSITLSGLASEMRATLIVAGAAVTIAGSLAIV